MRGSFFVTGTDTNVGKTYVSCGLLKAWRRSGVDMVGMKPVASGAEWRDGQWCNDDALALQAASTSANDHAMDQPGAEAPHYRLINPYCLPDATAPEIAAQRVGASIEWPVLDRAFRALQTSHAGVLVEGAGGAAVSLSSELNLIDLPLRWSLPCLLVVAIRLGCLNHAWLSVDYLQRRGLPLLGWVANHSDPDYPDRRDYQSMLERHLPVPLLGKLERDDDPTSFQHLAQRVSAAMLALQAATP